MPLPSPAASGSAAQHPVTLATEEPEIFAGRTVLAAGGPEGRYEYRKRGGEETHKLTPDEMPRHDHEPDGRLEGYWANVRGDSATNGFQGGSYRVTSRKPVAAGGSEAHNNMPPYIALYFCKKS
ncbi:hypothetical protein [Mangrovicoccus sp. HB161399]|uniref:hypothetical protein n=1 Tax=Mangrovicoccus sp. HB161399 TaxID=2720392 RepID=UPI001555EE73|nr:hypothetical protein [Mangrovicoccus sp. HB161399]